MSENWTSGMALVVTAGLMQGSYMLPTKFTSKWNWENMWLSYSILAYLLMPWLIALATAPQLMQILAETSAAAYVRTLLFGLAWGVGALTFALGIDYLGLALGFAIILGLTSSIGTLVPFFVLSSSKTTSHIAVILTGVVVMLAGIVLCAWAGNLKEKALGSGAAGTAARKSYALGLLFCVLAGVFSSFGNLGFAFASDMISVASRYGTPEQFAAAPFWAVMIFPLFLCNAGFCVYLLLKNKSISNFARRGTNHYHLLTASMGVLWLVGMIIYGVGASRLGEIGPSVGWAILMALIVIVANLWGMATGEWRGTGSKPVRIMSLGLVALVAAIFIIGSGNK